MKPDQHQYADGWWYPPAGGVAHAVRADQRVGPYNLV